MSALRVGMRVRIVAPHRRAGKQAVIVGFLGNAIRTSYETGRQEAGSFYILDVDGIGSRNEWGQRIGAFGHELEPLTLPPQLASWDSDEMPCDRDGRWRVREVA